MAPRMRSQELKRLKIEAKMVAVNRDGVSSPPSGTVHFTEQASFAVSGSLSERVAVR